MERYERKIKIKRELSTIDTDNDGIDDTIAYLNKDDLYVSFLLKQTVKDLGVYTDYNEEPEIIDLGGFWETSNTGFDDKGENPISGGVNNPYGSDVDVTEFEIGNSDLTVYGCTDPNDPNYNPLAEVDCCCSYNGDLGITEAGGNSGDGVVSSGGGCMELSTGWVEWDQENYPNPLLQPYGGYGNFQTYSIIKAIEWCKATHPDCNSNWVDNTSPGYPISSSCVGNGCGGNLCCPGPQNTYHVLTAQECEDNGIDCSGTSCGCSGGSIFSDVKLNYQLDSDSGLVNYTWRFYCVPD